MTRPRVLKPTAVREIERIAIERSKLLTDTELARKYCVSRRRIQQVMKRVRDRDAVPFSENKSR